jgi:hypothetical protein
MMLNNFHISSPTGDETPMSRRVIEKVLWKHVHIPNISAWQKVRGGQREREISSRSEALSPENLR